MPTTKTYVIPALFFLLIYILPLGIGNLMLPDETRYAEIPREMILSGDWVVPRFNGLDYFEKPVFGYWAHAVAQMIFGENPFAVRFPSALSIGLIAFLILLALKDGNKHPFENQRYAMAPLFFLSFLTVTVIGSIATLDSLFTLFISASIVFFFLATEAPRATPLERKWLLFAGIACGLAFLTKGFLAFALCGLVLASYLIWARRWKDLFRMCWIPLASVLLVALPWCLWIHQRATDFWDFFFWNEHIRRFASKDAQHSEPFYFFLKASPVLALPWTFLLPSSVAGCKNKLSEADRDARLIRLCLCWLVLPFLFFSIAKGKLFTYILPCIPPFALLIALGIEKQLEKQKYRWFHFGALCTSFVFTAAFVYLAYVQFFSANRAPLFADQAQGALMLAGFLALILFPLLAWKTQKASRKLPLLVAAPFLLLGSLHFLVPDRNLERKDIGPLFQRIKPEISAKTVVLADDIALGPACWYLKRTDLYLLEAPGELQYGLTKQPHRLIALADVHEFINANRGNLVLMMRQNHLEEWGDQLPEPLKKESSRADVFAVWTY